MFDIGFFELLLIGVVTLIVVGPKRLPETVRFVGLWVGRLRRSLSAAKSEFENEFGIDDVRRQLHNEEVMKNLGQTLPDKQPPPAAQNQVKANHAEPSEEGKPHV